MQRTVYIVDTSSWINLVKRYPAAVFPSLVQRYEDMIKNRQMLSPRPVFDEICRGNDAVATWAEKHEDVFVPNAGATVAHATKILHDHPALAGSGGKHNCADPYLIALALAIEGGVDGGSHPVIVTEESRASGIKIPQAAQGYGVESCSMLGMFEREKWVF